MLGGSLHDTYIETLSTLCESINNYIKLDNNIRLENKNIPITIISDISYNNMFVCHTYNISNSYIITDTHISVNKNIDEDCNYNNLITSTKLIHLFDDIIIPKHLYDKYLSYIRDNIQNIIKNNIYFEQKDISKDIKKYRQIIIDDIDNIIFNIEHILKCDYNSYIEDITHKIITSDTK